MSSILTVSQLNRYISFKIKEDNNLKRVLLRGEISNFTNHAKTGHLYFTVKDNESSVKAIMFNSFATRLNFIPYNGMSVIVSASVQVFERDGLYQLYVNDIQPDGIGALFTAVELLKKRLAEEGLFDEQYKKPLPAYPSRIAVVTSEQGAALQDILNILARRYPIAEVLIFPAIVQGEKAPQSLCEAIISADESYCDVIIVARGGGSFEDLMCFNSESVVRTIFFCNTPVISAVGHETDTTLCDFVSDLRAPTPSAAAELAVPDMNVLYNKLEEYRRNLIISEQNYIECLYNKLNSRYELLDKHSPKAKIALYIQICSSNKQKLDTAINNVMMNKYNDFVKKAEVLEKLNPIRIISSGYAVIYKDNKRIQTSGDLKKDDLVKINMSDGSVDAIII